MAKLRAIAKFNTTDSDDMYSLINSDGMYIQDVTSTLFDTSLATCKKPYHRVGIAHAERMLLRANAAAKYLALPMFTIVKL